MQFHYSFLCWLFVLYNEIPTAVPYILFIDHHPTIACRGSYKCSALGRLASRFKSASTLSRIGMMKTGRKDTPSVDIKKSLYRTSKSKLVDSKRFREIMQRQIIKGNSTNVIEYFKELTKNSDNREVNYLASQTLSLIANTGLWELYKTILFDLPNSIDFEPDTRTFTAAMSACIKQDRFSEAILIFEEMRKRHVPLDEVSLVCAIRAVGRDRFQSWSSSFDLLETAYEIFCATHCGDGDTLSSSSSLLSSSSSSAPSTKTSKKGHKKVLAVAHTCLINIKYLDEEEAVSGEEALRRCEQVFAWVVGRGIRPTSQTLDVLLAVASKHCSISDCQAMLLRRAELRIPLTVYTFNTLLNIHCEAGNLVEAEAILRDMKKAGFIPDSTTYNTMLKLFVKANDLEGVRDVLLEMASSGVAQSTFTRSLLLQLYASNRESVHLATELIDHLVDEEVTPHMFCNAITSSSDRGTALRLLQRASHVGAADQAVFVSAAKVCVEHGEPSRALKLMDTMLLKRGLRMDKYSLSFLLRTCFDQCRSELTLHSGVEIESDVKSVIKGGNDVFKFASDEKGRKDGEIGGEGEGQGRGEIPPQSVQPNRTRSSVSQPSLSLWIGHALRYLWHCHACREQRTNLSSAVCQKVIKELLLLNQTALACEVHLSLFSHTKCTEHTLDGLFYSLQSLGNDLNGAKQIDGNLDRISRLANNSYLLIKAYTSAPLVSEEFVHEGRESTASAASERIGTDNSTSSRERTNASRHVNAMSKQALPPDMRYQMLKTYHFNVALRLLCVVKQKQTQAVDDRVLDLVRLMKGGEANRPDRNFGVHSNSGGSSSSSGSSSRSKSRERGSSNNSLVGGVYHNVDNIRVDNVNSLDTVGEERATNRVIADSAITSDRIDENSSFAHSNSNTSTSTSSSQSVAPRQWAPTTFTIAELIRYSRRANSPVLAFQAAMWGVQKDVYIPLAMISDAIALIYRAGQTELVLRLYRHLFDYGYVNHWVSSIGPQMQSDDRGGLGEAARECLMMDLHNFNRGMAFAAINVGIKEIQNRKFSASEIPRYLTIITGKNLPSSTRHTGSTSSGSGNSENSRNDSSRGRRKSGGRDDELTAVSNGDDFYRRAIADIDALEQQQRRESGDDKGFSGNSWESGDFDEAYRLSDEVQRVLIEDFYPPISSSTVPGNPGRLYIDLSSPPSSSFSVTLGQDS